MQKVVNEESIYHFQEAKRFPIPRGVEIEFMFMDLYVRVFKA